MSRVGRNAEVIEPAQIDFVLNPFNARGNARRQLHHGQPWKIIAHAE